MKQLYCIFLLIVFSCNSNFNLEEKFNEALNFRKETKLKESITLLKQIIDSGKSQDFSAKAQYQLADIYLNDVNNYTFAVQEFEKLRSVYPHSDFTKKSIFMLGYINSNFIDSYNDAIHYYNMFLEKYPEDELVNSVRYELDLLDSLGIIDDLETLRNTK